MEEYTEGGREGMQCHMGQKSSRSDEIHNRLASKDSLSEFMRSRVSNHHTW